MAGMLFLFIESCVSVKQKRSVKIALWRMERCRGSDLPQAENSAKQDSFLLHENDRITERTGETMRIGSGYDVHRLTEGRKLILGGVEIPFEKGLLGHSDADVLVHAVMDALLGAAALGDIGKHFPDTDPAYKGADSMKLLSEVRRLIEKKAYFIENIDATVIAQRPKLAGYIPQMKKNIADVLGISEGQVNVKATTEEGLGFIGEGLGIAASAVCLAFKRFRIMWALM